ncbi:flavodoxin family protein [Solidesulfovibrio sp. C21]|uniref:flavodoxin family protein n=1 Tax=Solidesulfovibrio sp. C21 TaxID=3398613 RepID=UPI0039FC964E
MKVVAINGSPRKEGNTELLLEAVLKPLAESGWETELIRIGGKKIRGCCGCHKCWNKKDKHCIFGGADIFNDCFSQAVAADAIVLGSPVYFTDVTAEMKAFIDRAGFVALGNDCALSGKIGASVVALRRGGATHAFDTMNHLFFMSQMIVPGSIYWNMGYGLKPGDVGADEEAFRNMQHLGEAINWLGKTIEAGKASYPVVKEGELPPDPKA